MNTKISASILGCDLANLESEIKRIEASGADFIHFDVMDGVFVNNISFGLPVLESVKKVTNLPLDVHLMITEPEKYVERFILAGADIVTFHLEATSNIRECFNICRDNGVKAGIAIKPKTPVYEVFRYVCEVENILIMTVEPGFGGQGFLNYTTEKIKELDSFINSRRIKGVTIQVDGGITDITAKTVKENGADFLVAGTYLFKARDMKDAVEKLRTL